VHLPAPTADLSNELKPQPHPVPNLNDPRQRQPESLPDPNQFSKPLVNPVAEPIESSESLPDGSSNHEFDGPLMSEDSSRKVEIIPPSEIRFSQKTVSYQKIGRKKGGDYNYDEIKESMDKDGWIGDPVDIVIMPDGTATSVDNTRIRAAKETGKDVHAVIHKADEKISRRSARRFKKKTGELPSTWGEAVENRIGEQNDETFRLRNPYGSWDWPEFTGRPK
jgi:hypothetical protein